MGIEGRCIVHVDEEERGSLARRVGGDERRGGDEGPPGPAHGAEAAERLRRETEQNLIEHVVVDRRVASLAVGSFCWRSLRRH